MISIIVSTYKPESFKQLKSCVQKTIGVPYEIIPVQNPGLYSICEAYNMGVAKAQYPYFCFVHDDVIIHTKDWGQLLINRMDADRKIGLIGIAGSKFKSTYPTTGWGTGPFVKNLWRGHYKTTDAMQQTIEVDLDKRLTKPETEEVVVVDGLFLFTKSEVLTKCRFDAAMLTHFHGYDTDFSLQVIQNGYKVIVDRSLDVFHHSKGVQGAEFAKANRAIYRKWSSKLPVASPDLRFGSLHLYYYNLLIWAGYLWFALQRKLKLK